MLAELEELKENLIKQTQAKEDNIATLLGGSITNPQSDSMLKL